MASRDESSKVDPDESALPHKPQYVSLGRLCVVFQQMEVRIAAICWELIGGNQRIGQSVTANLSFSRICEVAVSLSREKFGDGHDVTSKINDFVKRASIFEQERNKYVHSFWLEGDDGPIRGKMTTSRKRGLSLATEPDVSEKMDETSRSIIRLSCELDEFFHAQGFLSE